MPISTVIHTNEQSFNRVLNAGVPVLLVFWQQGAAPDSKLEATLDALASEYAGKALIAKVDAATETGLLARYSLQQLPAFLLVKNGAVETTGSASSTSAELSAWLAYLVNGGKRPPDLVSRPANGHASSHSSSYSTSTNGKYESAGVPGAKPIILSDANFQQIVSGPSPVLVDFWAAWCGPCRMVAPVIEQLAEEFQGRAIVGKLNVDENPSTAQRYSVMSIPTLLIFKSGVVVDQIVGAQPADVLRSRLAAHAT